MQRARSSAIVVGGSLSGLALAVALRRAGVSVTVVEQTSGDGRGGTGLGVDRRLLGAVTGVDAASGAVVAPLPVVRTHRETSTWHQIRTWLQAVVATMDGIDVREGARVDEAIQTEARAVVRGPGLELEADVVVGADGYRSVVRRAIDPSNPTAPYGGFVIWRGLVDEAWLPAGEQFEGGILPYLDTARIVMYFVPGPNGETHPGARRITFAWYDGSRTAWLRERAFLTTDDEVTSSVPFEAIQQDLRADLEHLARTRWPPATARVLLTALDRSVFFGTPLAQYLPSALANKSIAMVGDAAHVSSPMVGAGLTNGLLDCLALARSIAQSGGLAGSRGVDALRSYETARLGPNRDHVEESMLVTARLLQSVQDRT
jgi:2-polyprenyl-6-methoxyphenol hydroxylase-like FAD-dependent oxidoreductase